MWAVDLGKFVSESFFKRGDEPEDRNVCDL